MKVGTRSAKAHNLKGKEAESPKLGPPSGTAYNLQGNESEELKRENELYKKLKPAGKTAKAVYVKKVGYFPKKCSSTQCIDERAYLSRTVKSSATDGAHVLLETSESCDVYIIPTCHRCNTEILRFDYSMQEGAPLFLCTLTEIECKQLADLHRTSVKNGKSRVKVLNAELYWAKQAEKSKKTLAEKTKKVAAKLKDAVHRTKKNPVSTEEAFITTAAAVVGGDTDDVDRVHTVREGDVEGKCNSRDTVSGKPCKNGVGCSIDHASRRKDREQNEKK
jgi:hypothetical protein